MVKPEQMTLKEFRAKMQELLDKGPENWTPEEVEFVKRMTNVLIKMAENFNKSVHDTLQRIIDVMLPLMAKIEEEKKKYEQDEQRQSEGVTDVDGDTICVCGHRADCHHLYGYSKGKCVEHGCVCSGFRKQTEAEANEMCYCGHIRHVHNYRYKPGMGTCMQCDCLGFRRKRNGSKAGPSNVQQ